MMARSRITLAVVAFLVLLGVFIFSLDGNSAALGSWSLPLPNLSHEVTHIVLFQYKEDATSREISETNRQMLALKDKCIHPKTKKPYIKSLTGGKDNSIEGQQAGMSYAFVVEFETVSHRSYYVNTDEVHQAFKEAAGKVLEKAIVVDFSDGRF